MPCGQMKPVAQIQAEDHHLTQPQARCQALGSCSFGFPFLCCHEDFEVGAQDLHSQSITEALETLVLRQQLKDRSICSQVSPV